MEIYPSRYDIQWWRDQWKCTRVQGIIVNAGGIVAYYPSDYLLQHRGEYLHGRDRFGEISAVAREDGLSVIARMDSNRAHEEFFREQPGYFTRDSHGNPITAGDLYVAYIFSDYYDVFLPNVLREIASGYKPDGFTDNSWQDSDVTRFVIAKTVPTNSKAWPALNCRHLATGATPLTSSGFDGTMHGVLKCGNSIIV